MDLLNLRIVFLLIFIYLFIFRMCSAFFLKHYTPSLHSESDWSQDDRRQEQKLMDELVAIIEQRNQIISSLDQDRQRCVKMKIIPDASMFCGFLLKKSKCGFVLSEREREEDMLLEAMMKNKGEKITFHIKKSLLKIEFFILLWVFFCPCLTLLSAFEEN